MNDPSKLITEFEFTDTIFDWMKELYTVHYDFKSSLNGIQIWSIDGSWSESEYLTTCNTLEEAKVYVALIKD